MSNHFAVVVGGRFLLKAAPRGNVQLLWRQTDSGRWIRRRVRIGSDAHRRYTWVDQKPQGKRETSGRDRAQSTKVEIELSTEALAKLKALAEREGSMGSAIERLLRAAPASGRRRPPRTTEPKADQPTEFHQIQRLARDIRVRTNGMVTSAVQVRHAYGVLVNQVEDDVPPPSKVKTLRALYDVFHPLVGTRPIEKALLAAAAAFGSAH